MEVNKSVGQLFNVPQIPGSSTEIASGRGRGSRLGVWACRRLRQTRIQRLDEKRLLRAWRVGLRTRAEERMTHMQRPPTRGSGRAGSSDPEVSEAKFLHGFRVE
jgi:hypothetical protein